MMGTSTPRAGQRELLFGEKQRRTFWRKSSRSSLQKGGVAACVSKTGFGGRYTVKRLSDVMSGSFFGEVQHFETWAIRVVPQRF